MPENSYLCLRNHDGSQELFITERKIMAVLEKIVVQDFRNIVLAELEFSANINCISGGNGEGKTNLMDAVWYLSMTKSAFRSSDRDNFRFGTDMFSISGVYAMPDGLHSRYSIKVSAKGEKKLRRDDKPYPRVSQHIGELPVVMVSPDDNSLVSDSGEDRRRFMNMVLSQMDKEYLSDVQQYNRLLSQRNILLKSPSPDLSLLEIMDMRMDASASRIYGRRKEFVSDLSPVVEKYYRLLSGGKESVQISYRSDLEKEALTEILMSARNRDLALGYTSVGPQRDDLVFMMDGHQMRRCGSQGQQKSFLVSLKFAQYELMKQRFGVPPTLLLDDVFDKLDMDRTANLLSMVAGSDFGQIFITDSNKVRLSAIVDGITEDRAYFETSGGNFRRL